MDQTAYNFFSNKIQNVIANKYNQNINAFINENQDCNSFITKYNLNIVLRHMHFDITNEEYQQILNSIQSTYPIQEEIVIKEKTTEKKIAEIVDTINLAIITGGFIGIILLNIYSRIAQYF